jgi:lipoprotein-anchoring transpeptidase ErfK/SrfK
MRFANREFKTLKSLAVLLLAAAAETLADQQPQPRRRIVVSIPDRQAALVEDGRVVKIYPVAVGKSATPTPAGTFAVVQRIPYPTWYTAHRVVPPGKANPLGTRWIVLSRKGYGIHGTNAPNSVGRRASHGCVRLRNADVEDLFDRVAVGDVVELYDRRGPETDAVFPPPAGTVQLASAAGGL